MRKWIIYTLWVVVFGGLVTLDILVISDNYARFCPGKVELYGMASFVLAVPLVVAGAVQWVRGKLRNFEKLMIVVMFLAELLFAFYIL